MKVYYAHFMGIYNTKQEERDIKLLESLGYEVLNPNQQIHAEGCRSVGYQTDPMSYFLELIDSCDVVAFRGLPTGRIPSGVYKEVCYANNMGKPVFELPVDLVLRGMSLEETRAMLREYGQR